ncbi:MAG: hypothetical protein HY704_07515 [Gemmatimonadetes bacterium]|nr:hypothetical protein [Gemmatimonadota bacterium]
MFGREQVYEVAVSAVRALSPLLARGESKLARGVRGRRDAVRRLVEWAAAYRDRARPLVWFHAPSVGEALQAKAVMDALRRTRPELQLVFTFFSPSAEGIAARMGADAAGYLPWDVTADVRAVVQALAPTIIAFTKTEVWPILAGEASAAGARLVLVGATLPAGARRLSAGARFLLRPAFGRLDAVAAIAEEDARRFTVLGVEPGRVPVTGDPAIDSAAERVDAASPDAPYLRPFHADPRPTVVAGSTWPPDEVVLLPAMARVRGALAGVRLVIAPHEPAAAHVSRLADKLARDAWTTARLGEVEVEGRAGADAVIVDRVGVLGHLYTIGRAAYVGGGFGRAGLHSVLEPAAAGLPVAFGPRHHNARAAAELAAAGAAIVARDPAELAGAMTHWLDSDEAWGYAHRRALDYISGHRGAAERTAALLVGLLSGIE